MTPEERGKKICDDYFSGIISEVNCPHLISKIADQIRQAEDEAEKRVMEKATDIIESAYIKVFTNKLKAEIEELRSVFLKILKL